MATKVNSETGLDSGVVAGSKTANIASYVLMGRIFTFLMIGIALILVTRLLGPTQYGIYTLAVAFAGIFGSIGYFGVGTALNKFISEYREKKNTDEISVLFSNGIFLVLVSGVVLTLLCFALSSLASQYIFHTASLSYVVKAVSFWIIGAMLFGTIYDSLLGLGKGQDIALVAGIEAFFQAGISIALALMGLGALAPIYGLVFGYFIGFAIGIGIMFRSNKLRLCMPSAKQVKKLLGFSVPVATANIFSSAVGSFGLLFLGYFVFSAAVIGNIGAASRTGTLMSVIFDSVGFAILPTFSAALANGKLKTQIGRIYGYTVYTAILTVSPLLFYMAIFSVPFSFTVFGSGYSSAPLYISLISMGLLLGIAGTYANTLMISMGRTKSALAYNSIAYAVTILLFIILVPRYGGIGYAVASFIVMPLLIDVIFIFKLRQSLKINFRARKLLGILLANVVVSLLVFQLSIFFNGIALLALAAAGVAILYPIAAVVAGGADMGDINTIKALAKGVPFVGGAVSWFADYAAVAIR